MTIQYDNTYMTIRPVVYRGAVAPKIMSETFLSFYSSSLLSMYWYKQCCGSVLFLYGSGSSDPFREITDPDPAPNPT